MFTVLTAILHDLSRCRSAGVEPRLQGIVSDECDNAPVVLSVGSGFRFRFRFRRGFDDGQDGGVIVIWGRGSAAAVGAV